MHTTFERLVHPRRRVLLLQGRPKYHRGPGVSFDGLNPTNGFHPLWLALCIPVFALARFDLILPLRILLIASAGLHASTVVLLFRLLRSALSTPVAVMAAAYWAFDPRLHYTFYEFGLESALALFALVSFLLSCRGSTRIGVIAQRRRLVSWDLRWSRPAWSSPVWI